MRFCVTDNGIGMTEDQAKIVFDAFTQADSSTTRRFGGTGLGLALCKQYCDLMGATIHVVSSIQAGTEFTVEFPIKTNIQNPVKQLTNTSLSSENTDKKTILVIDDDATALTLMERFLQKSHFNICLLYTSDAADE